MTDSRMLCTPRWKYQNGATFLYLGKHPTGFVYPAPDGLTKRHGFSASFILPTAVLTDHKAPQAAYGGVSLAWFPTKKAAMAWVRTHLHSWLDGASS